MKIAEHGTAVPFHSQYRKMALLLADPSKVMLVTSKQGRDAYHLPSML